MILDPCLLRIETRIEPIWPGYLADTEGNSRTKRMSHFSGNRKHTKGVDHRLRSMCSLAIKREPYRSRPRDPKQKSMHQPEGCKTSRRWIRRIYSRTPLAAFSTADDFSFDILDKKAYKSKKIDLLKKTCHSNFLDLMIHARNPQEDRLVSKITRGSAKHEVSSEAINERNEDISQDLECSAMVDVLSALLTEQYEMQASYLSYGSNKDSQANSVT